MAGWLDASMPGWTDGMEYSTIQQNRSRIEYNPVDDTMSCTFGLLHC